MPKYSKEQRKQILARTIGFMQGYIEKNGKSPTLQEIANAIMYSREWVRLIVGHLEAKGYLKVEHGKKRGIKILKPYDTEK